MNEEFGPDNPVAQMSDDQAWEFLRSFEVGRLAVMAAGVLDIYPITYVVDSDNTIVFRTAPGTKLLELTVNDQVAFEVDHYDETTAQSVVVHGTAHRLETQPEIDAAEALPLASLIPTPRFRYVRVVPSTVSGRKFYRG
jgi:uncharacterized protein